VFRCTEYSVYFSYSLYSSYKIRYNTYALYETACNISYIFYAVQFESKIEYCTYYRKLQRNFLCILYTLDTKNYDRILYVLPQTTAKLPVYSLYSSHGNFIYVPYYTRSNILQFNHTVLNT
jgi:hypothetical protein